MSIQCVCFPSLTRLTQVCIHNKSLTSYQLQSILPVFDINSFRSEQEMALYAFLTVKDVFINLPTGSEKSIIYQLVQLLSLRSQRIVSEFWFG